MIYAEENNMDIKADLFGRVSYKGPHNPDPARLRATFVEGDSVLYRFCRGCGLPAEVNEKIARRLANEAGTPFADVLPTGMYFETEGCAFCANGETVGLTLKEIPTQQ